MTGQELNEIKWREISPMIDEMIYVYQKDNRNDYEIYTRDCFKKLEKNFLEFLRSGPRPDVPPLDLPKLLFHVARESFQLSP